MLDETTVGQLIAGLEAGRAERDRAATEDTPYGRYRKAVAAYAVAQPKCQAAQQTFPQRMAGNQKLSDQYSALVDKMVAAQAKGDQKLMAVYSDSAMAMQDPSCTIKQPQQPDDYYEAQREADSRAEKQEMKASGFNRSELAMVKERAEGILRGADAPGDASQSERAAVSAQAGKLKPLLGINPPARAAAARGRRGASGSCRAARAHRLAGGDAHEQLRDQERADAPEGARGARQARRGGQRSEGHESRHGDRRHDEPDPDGRLPSGQVIQCE